MSEKLPLHGFKWIEQTSQFNEDFVKKLEYYNIIYRIFSYS